MKKIFKTIIYTVFTLSLMMVNTDYANAATSPTKTTAESSAAVNVSPVTVVNNPSNYLNKNITFTAEFVSFTSLGLDYKPAFRDKEKYIGILIARPDITDHTIPLSEMKIFLTRELAEKNADLEAGDKIKITGKVFSTALGDPWVDIKTLTILTSKNKTEKK